MQTNEEAPSTPREKWWAVGLIALVLVPLVVSAFYLWFSVGTSYRPNTDWAIFELRARDVFDHGVFVGAYSRYGWNHPGPLLFYVLAVPYKLMGSRSISMHITALLVNGAAIVMIGWLAFRRGRLPMLVAVLVPVTILTHSLGADILRSPWNPYLPILPLLLLLLLCWSVAVGDLWMLPVAIAVASFAIQSHVGLALVCVAFVALALVGIVIRGFRTDAGDRRVFWVRVAKVVAASAGVFVVLWSPVFYGTVVQQDGNIDKLVGFFTAQHQYTAGITKGFQVMGLQWGPRPEWIVGPRGLQVIGNQTVEPQWYLAIGVVFGAAAALVAYRRRSWETLWLAGFLAFGIAVAIISISKVVDLLYPYLTRWTWVLGATLGILVLRGIWLAIPVERRAAVFKWVLPVTLVVLVLLTAMETVDALNAGTPLGPEQGAEHSITNQVLEHLPPGKGPVLIETSHGNLVAPGLALQLERHGIPTKLTPGQVVVYGKDRTPNGGPYRAKLVPVFGDSAIKKFKPTGPRIAHYVKPQTAEDRERIKGYFRAARKLPPGPDRTAFLKLLNDGAKGPAVEISVFLANPKRP